MKNFPLPPIGDSLRFGPSVLAEGARSANDQWLHDFRNALGTVVLAADTAKSMAPDRASVEFSIAMRRIEEGCNRCLRLLRTMPTS